MKYLLGILFLLYSIFGLTQEAYLVVNQDSLSSEEFNKTFASNIQAEGKEKAISTYIDFVLLRQAAEKTQIDTTVAFQNLLKQNLQPYRDQILFDSDVEQALMDELWPQLQVDKKVEIYALGIQNMHDLQSRNQREKLINELHATVCTNKKPTPAVVEYTQKYPVKTLWLRPFTTASEFERTTFQTEVGTCSGIQKSENGNYFVKVLEQRPSAGIVYLDYIYSKDKSKIVTALDSVQSGMKWSDAKSKFGSYEGVNGYFGKPRYEADLPEPFYNEIQKLGDKQYSAPFAANDGWYIIQLKNQEKFAKKEDWKDWMTERIKESDYALAFVKNSERRANSQVKVEENAQALRKLKNYLGKQFFATNKELKNVDDQPIWSAQYSVFSFKQFVDEMVLAKGYYGENTDFDSFWNDVVPKFKQQFILNEYVQNLGYYEPEYKANANLLKESILVNYYVDNFIFDAAKKDTVGLNNFLQRNAAKYTWQPRYDLEVFKYTTAEQGKLIQKLLKSGKTNDEILAQFEGQKNQNGALEVVLVKGLFEENHELVSLLANKKRKLHKATWNDKPVIIRLNKVYPSKLKTVNEAGYNLKEDYKSAYYRQHLNQLKKDATIILPKAF